MDHQNLTGTVRGHLLKDWFSLVQVPVFTDGPNEGQIDEPLLLQRLQAGRLVSQHVREIYVEPDGPGAWTVVDVAADDSVAWFSVPIGAGY